MAVDFREVWRMTMRSYIGGLFLLLAMGSLVACGFGESSCSDWNDTECGGSCVNLISDDANCGACGFVCGADETCIGGFCEALETCVTNGCPAGEFCNERWGECVSACSRDSHCSGEQTCDWESGRCECPERDDEVCSSGCCAYEPPELTLLGDGQPYALVDIEGSSSGKLHVGLVRKNTDDIFYGRETADSSFELEEVTRTSAERRLSGRLALDVDDSGAPHLAYVRQTSDRTELMHAIRGADGWQYESVGDVPWRDDRPNLVAPSTQHVRILVRSDEQTIWQYKGTSGDWLRTNVAASAGDGNRSADIALDHRQQPFLLYNAGRDDSSDWGLRLASAQDTGQGEALGIDSCSLHPSLAFDDDGRPHVAFCGRRSGRVTYGVRQNGEWTFEAVDETRDAHHVTLAVSSTGQPHVVMVDDETGIVRYGRRDDGRWEVRTLGESFAIGTGQDAGSRLIDVAITGDDRVVVAFIQTDSEVAFWEPAR